MPFPVWLLQISLLFKTAHMPSSVIPSQDATAHKLPGPQEPEGRKGRPNSVTQGEYLRNENWFHINEKYQFYILKILHLGSLMPESNKMESEPEAVTGIQPSQSGRTLSPLWKGDSRQGRRPRSQSLENGVSGKHWAYRKTLDSESAAWGDCSKASTQLHQSGQQAGESRG